jgi:hypothetical protein
MGVFKRRSSHVMRMTVLVASLGETDFAYLAGIVDGEGTVSIHRNVTRRKGRIFVGYQPQLTISNTDLRMLESLQGRFGGHIVKANTPAKKDWKQGYLLCFRRKEMVVLLQRLNPYLISKRRKAEMLFEYMNTRTKGVSTGEDGRFVGIPLTDRQKQIIAEIRKNNKRGPSI